MCLGLTCRGRSSFMANRRSPAQPWFPLPKLKSARIFCFAGGPPPFPSFPVTLEKGKTLFWLVDHFSWQPTKRRRRLGNATGQVGFDFQLKSLLNHNLDAFASISHAVDFSASAQRALSDWPTSFTFMASSSPDWPSTHRRSEV